MMKTEPCASFMYREANHVVERAASLPQMLCHGREERSKAPQVTQPRLVALVDIVHRKDDGVVDCGAPPTTDQAHVLDPAGRRQPTAETHEDPVCESMVHPALPPEVKHSRASVGEEPAEVQQDAVEVGLVEAELRLEVDRVPEVIHTLARREVLSAAATALDQVEGSQRHEAHSLLDEPGAKDLLV